MISPSQVTYVANLVNGGLRYLLHLLHNLLHLHLNLLMPSGEFLCDGLKLRRLN